MKYDYDIIVDVRSKKEFDEEHIEDSVDLPLDFIESRESRVAKLLRGKKVLLMCRSGRRAELAKNILAPHGEIASIDVYPGGILEYKKEFPEQILSGAANNTLPIMRQVQITAGLLIILFAVLGFTLSPNFFYGDLFIGCGLLYAGISGNCMMAKLLQKMPWNR